MNPGPWVKHSENVGIAARICMTHSYLHMKEQFGYEPETLEEKEIKKYIVGCGEADEYDRLIQMCDALATDYGFVILEKRLVVNFFLENLLTLYRPCVSINFAPQKPQFFGGKKI